MLYQQVDVEKEMQEREQRILEARKRNEEIREECKDADKKER